MIYLFPSPFGKQDNDRDSNAYRFCQLNYTESTTWIQVQIWEQYFSDSQLLIFKHKDKRKIKSKITENTRYNSNCPMNMPIFQWGHNGPPYTEARYTNCILHNRYYHAPFWQERCHMQPLSLPRASGFCVEEVDLAWAELEVLCFTFCVGQWWLFMIYNKLLPIS